MTVKRTRLKSTLPKAATWSVPGRSKDGASSNGSSPNQGDETGNRLAATPLTTTSKRRLQRRATPLAVLQMPLQAGVRKVFDLRRFLIVLALTIIVLLLPTPPGLSEQGHRALALFIFTGAILALEPAPLPIAALLVPICQIAFGIDQVSGAFAPFGQPIIFLIIGSLFLAEALRKHGLTRRLALYVIIGSGGNFRRLLLGLMIVSAVLSMWVLNTAIAAVLIPVAIPIAQRVKRPEDARQALTVLILGIAYASGIGAVATTMGSNENAIAFSLLNQQISFGFLDWMKYGLPLVVIVLPLSWFLLLAIIPLPHIVIDTAPIANELERTGGLSGPQREIIFVLTAAVGLWVTGSSIEEWLGLPTTLLNSAVVALGAVALLSIEEVIDWNDLKGVNWGVFFVIGAGLTLGDALDKTGTSLWLAQLLAPLLTGLPYFVILIALVSVTFVLTQFMNSVTLGAIFAPILITLGISMDINPARLLLPTIFTMAFCYMLPISSARMTLVSITGGVSTKDMVRAGLCVGLPSAILVIVYFYISSSLGLI